jgi:hypothetical protein
MGTWEKEELRYGRDMDKATGEIEAETEMIETWTIELTAIAIISNRGVRGRS